jgi:CDP-6-deoxy-D-xylo-4-hexulose-3-dehydrase
MSAREFWFPTGFKYWGVEEDEAIARVISSGWFTYGKEVAAFEEEYAAYHKRKYAVMVNSGSSANLIAVAALCNLRSRKPLSRGDTALVPAVAWSTTYAPLIQHGLELRLLDVDDTWNAYPYGGTESFRLIVGCSILGSPARLEECQKFANRNGAYFINDDCESLGASIGGRTTASFGLMATSSFFASHQISAIEGGAILTDEDECYRLCRMLRSHGWTRDVEPPKNFDEEYSFELFGLNVRPVEMHAAIAREQLKKLSHMIDARQKNLDHFWRLMQGLPIALQGHYLGTKRSSFGIAFTVANKNIRSKLADALRAEDIDCRLPTGGSFRMHKYGERWRAQATPNADRIHETGLFLGLAPFPIEDKIERAVNVMKGVL